MSDLSAVLRDCRRMEREGFYQDRDYAIQKLNALYKAADDAAGMLPAKFHAPFVGIMAIALDAVTKLRADTKPLEYWIGDEAAVEDYLADDANRWAKAANVATNG